MIVLGFGSNIGNREQNINDAVRLLSVRGVEIEQLSSLYETAPVGYLAQPAFLNAVASVSYNDNLTPITLLRICQEVEEKLGRKRDIHWGPRIIDIDLLIFNDIEMNDAELTLPHPFLTQRRFVLVPLSQLTDEAIIAGYSAQELLTKCIDKSAVDLYKVSDKDS